MKKPRTPNTMLAARVRQLGFSQAELAEKVNSACERLTGERGCATDRYVRQLLDGTVLWPHDAYRASLEAVLGSSALDLGFIPRSSKPPNARKRRPRNQERQSQKEAPVIRRDFLRLSSGTVLSVTLPDLTVIPRISTTEIDALRTNLAELHSLDDRHGGGLVANLAVQQADRIHAALRSSTVTERIERSLYSIAGGYMSAAGWFALDAGHHDLARTYLDRAMRAALVARDPLLQAQTWNNMNLQEYRLGNKSEAFAIARTAVSSPAMRRDPTVAALLHARVALGHAEAGEKGMAARSFGRAAEALAKADGRVPPIWMTFFTPAELKGLSAIGELHLGRYASAAVRTETALNLIPESHTRNRLHYMIRLADAHLRARSVDAACTTGHLALDLAGAVQSAHSTAMLSALRARMAPWRKTVSAQEWMDRHDATTQ